MSCQHLNELTLENLISKANYPVFRCEECIRVGERSAQAHTVVIALEKLGA